MAKVTYNERSWAIDVISEINLFLSNKSWNFKSAGGESTINNDKSSLFPDVLIFKDRSKEIILHGWELKMPDTSINDSELISNAIKKANILQRDSFILWNVKQAVLYTKNGETFAIFKSWNDINVNARKDVKSNENLWKQLLHDILNDLNSYFESGKISDYVTFEILAVDAIIDVILENIPSTSENLTKRARTNARLDAKINKWWLSSAAEYGYNPSAIKDNPNKFSILSKVILTDWVFKIIFANVLKRHFNEAKTIESINFDTTIDDAKQIISKISEHCNFWNIFSDNLAIENISEISWKQIVQLNQFLSSINIEGVEIKILHNLLQSSIDSAKRKVAGQFATPPKLADLLVRLTIENKEGFVIDPCCGTGTIINQAFLLKEEYEIQQSEIIQTIWASDKHSFPIQLSTLTLSRPNNIGEVLNIFVKDVIDLQVGESIKFKDPNNGNAVEKKMPRFDYVVSNLPFIKNKEIKILNPDIYNINNFIQQQSETIQSLSGKSDIFAYIPFYLHQIMNENGKIGLILSNAWLGTDYGEIFLELIQKFFDIELVIISGNGKWFNNADVVTTFLIATKRNPIDQINLERNISFCTLKENLDSLTSIKELSEDILLGTESKDVSIETYSVREIKNLETYGIPWSALFSKLNWIDNVRAKLIGANMLFSFTRGERRGQNELFYPKDGHNIESDYLAPLLKDLRATKGLRSIPNKVAFCCSKSLRELRKIGHTGAINWIKSFENKVNGTGVLLPIALARTGMHWYEMQPKQEGDFVANINYDKSLFISIVEENIFIDQRMIVFTTKENYRNENPILILALLNSIISMFFIECFGFGRGLGALDLRESKIKEDYKILNLDLLDDNQKEIIVRAFQPILSRNRLVLEDELLKEDRVNFERVLFEIFSISEYYNAIKDSLIHLYKIRFAVKDNEKQ